MPGSARASFAILLLLAAAGARADTETASVEPCTEALAPNEPMYAVVSGRDEQTARLQLSFEYRLFCDRGVASRWVGWTERLHFGYTQTTLWDLAGDSRPFRDNTFRPSIYWQEAERRAGWRPDFLRGGYEHESNGREGIASRSLNLFFLQTGWLFEHGNQTLTIAPRWRVHASTSRTTREIEHYRGHVDLHLRYGRDDSWLLAATLRRGDRGYGSLELEASYPLQLRRAPRTGAFVYFQVFNGYGETLLGFDQDSGTQLRAGLAIVR